MSFSYRQAQILGLEDVDLHRKRIFLRLDLNVPMREAEILDDSRIRAALKTIQYCLNQEATLLIGSHLGRPDGKRKTLMSLFPVAKRLSELLDHTVSFIDDCIGDGPRHLVKDLKPCDILMLENLRFHHGEKSSEDKFAQMLQNGCEVYVNDAFGVLHREDASVCVLPKLMDQRCAGFLIESELLALRKLLKAPEKPYVLLLGGAKVSDKIRLIENMLPKVSTILIGGAMAYTFLKARGQTVGASRVEDDMVAYAQKIMTLAREKNVELVLPEDHVISKDADPQSEASIRQSQAIPDGWAGYDLGSRSIAKFMRRLDGAKTIFWNGPMGLYEKSAFAQGTEMIGKHIVQLDAYRVIGGGDSAAAMKSMGLDGEMDHISTGGGASLAYLSGQALPGLKALS